jgi:hypothetical protein
MTEEENNHLAEKICEADIERLWNSDYTVLCPEQSAIGTMCEMAVLYGWKYMVNKILEYIKELGHPMMKDQDDPTVYINQLSDADCAYILKRLGADILYPQWQKKNYAHYFDIRTNHLNEKDWRRSFSIN